MMRSSNPNSTIKLIGVIFSFVGLLMLGISAIMFVIGTNVKKNYTEVPAVVSDIRSYRDNDGDRHSTVYVDYEFEGEEFYDCKLDYYSSDMNVGDRVTIYIDSDRPYEMKSLMPGFVYIILIALGVIFGGIGFGMLFASRSKGSKELMQTGMAVEATVTFCGVTNVSVNGNTTYKVEAEYTDSMGVSKRVKTPLMYVDPTPYVQSKGGKITVYVDPTKPKKYYINTDEISTAVYSGQYGITDGSIDQSSYNYEGPPKF